MKKLTLALALSASTAALASGPVRCPAANPNCPQVPVRGDDPEHIKVEAPRIDTVRPGDVLAELEANQDKGPSIVGGGSASAAEVNNSGKNKAKKAKQASDAGQNGYWRSLVKNVWQDLLKSIEVQGSSRLDVKLRDPQTGTEVLDLHYCRDIALNSENGQNCAKTKVQKLQDGRIAVEVDRLVVKRVGTRNEFQLVYSTDDTMNFIVNNADELLAILREVDPEVTM